MNNGASKINIDHKATILIRFYPITNLGIKLIIVPAKVLCKVPCNAKPTAKPGTPAVPSIEVRTVVRFRIPSDKKYFYKNSPYTKLYL